MASTRHRQPVSARTFSYSCGSNSGRGLLGEGSETCHSVCSEILLKLLRDVNNYPDLASRDINDDVIIVTANVAPGYWWIMLKLPE